MILLRKRIVFVIIIKWIRTDKKKKENNLSLKIIDILHKTNFVYMVAECNWRLMEFPKSKFMYSLAQIPAQASMFCRVTLTRRYFRKSRRLPMADKSFVRHERPAWLRRRLLFFSANCLSPRMNNVIEVKCIESPGRKSMVIPLSLYKYRFMRSRRGADLSSVLLSLSSADSLFFSFSLSRSLRLSF